MTKESIVPTTLIGVLMSVQSLVAFLVGIILIVSFKWISIKDYKN